MKFPEEVLSVVKEANANNPSAEDAVEEALGGVKALSSYDDFVGTLVESAVQNLVYDGRHYTNTQIKNQAGAYNTTPKTVVGDSPAVKRAEISVYLYAIAGTSLGDVLGKDLLDIATHEDNKAEGHVFNSRLLRRLSNVVPTNKKVKNAISQKKLKALFSELQAVPETKQETAKEPSLEERRLELAGA